MKLSFFISFFSVLFFFSCKGQEKKPPNEHSIESKNEYWYAGLAEINSYQLEQARYGEIRKGTSVLLFVTEPFSTKNYVKADNPTNEDISVLKTINTKNFDTGVYPYSIMTSSFFPFESGEHSVKITSSSQEWCGHTFMELKNKNTFEIDVNSYFEGESFEGKSVEKVLLEDDLWAMIRLNPTKIPTGEQKMIPAFSYLRLMHKETKAYKVKIEFINEKLNKRTISLYYPELDRTLKITFENDFPFKILSWEDTYLDGFGPKAQRLTTKGKLLKTKRLDYWNRNKNEDSHYRKELKLPVSK